MRTALAQTDSRKTDCIQDEAASSHHIAEVSTDSHTRRHELCDAGDTQGSMGSIHTQPELATALDTPPGGSLSLCLWALLLFPR
jgi:hypothetical protein